ncbi:MAG: hypothetical protein V4443_10735 [Pseudomonadota bacterium]
MGHSEDSAVKKNSSMFALIGLVLLFLTPFSILKNMQIFFVAIVVASLLRLFVKWPKIGDRPIAVPLLSKLKRIHYCLLAIVLYELFDSLISLLLLLSYDDVDVFGLLWRSFSQLAALLVYMLTTVCGYHMAVHFDIYHIRRAIYVPFFLMVAVCTYQVFSESFGLPYIGNYVFDKFVGLRPSGLASEPKFLSSYFAVIIFFLLYDFRVRERRASQFVYLIKLSGLMAAAYFFLAAASGNGFLSISILSLVYFSQMKIWQKLAVGGVIFMILFWLWNQIGAGGIDLRGSHQDILDNISSLDLTLFDDLIALPLMAWRDNIWSLLIGFGPGLMHFFAHRYSNYSTWLTDETYIEGNLGVITFVSNFGLVLFIILFVFFAKRGLATLKTQLQSAWFPVNLFFLSSFFVGALVQGNSSIPFFLSLGWILRWSIQRNIHNSDFQKFKLS